MIHALPKFLAYILSTLFFITIISQLINENPGASLPSTNIKVERNEFLISRKGSPPTKYYSLYTNMDEIRKMNSDVIPSRSSNLTARELCDEANMCVPANIQYHTRFKISPKYKMIHCVVEKSMSTVMTGIMCYLSNNKRFVNVDQKKNMTEWEKASLCRGDPGKKYIKNVLSTGNSENMLGNGWSLSMITRNPVERFVSGYVDRCIRAAQGTNPCNGCDKNMTCFIISEYQRFMKQTKRKQLTNTVEDRHFYPQNWRCDLRTMKSKYEFIRYSSDPSKELMSDLFEIAKKQGVPDDELQYIEELLTMNRKTSHTTAYSPTREFFEKRLRENPLLMEYVVKMFYHDFVILNYPFPDGF